MNRIFLSATICLAALFTACSGGGGNSSSTPSSESDSNVGNGILAPLAEKYVKIAEINKDCEEQMKEAGNSDTEKLDKIANEAKEKKDVLVDEAKSIAENLKGKSIDCTAAENTGLSGLECSIFGVKASTSSATVTLQFKASAPIEQAYGCLYLDESGKPVSKLKTFTNGDGSMGIIYTIGTKNDGESARIAAQIASVKIVTVEEFESTAIPE